MALPIRIDAGLREVPLPSARPVALRVFRLAFVLAFPWFGGVWAVAVPVAVIDRGASPARWHPIIEPGMAMAAAMAVSGVVSGVSAASRRRRR